MSDPTFPACGGEEMAEMSDKASSTLGSFLGSAISRLSAEICPGVQPIFGRLLVILTEKNMLFVRALTTSVSVSDGDLQTRMGQ
jgi:hypothetical protein